MAEKQTAITLLQVVALLLPAVAIYLQIVTTENDLSNMDHGEAANYHAIRLTFVYLLGSGIVLIGAFLIFPTWATGGERLIDIALVLLLLSLVTFALPIVFSKVGLSDSRSILWPYWNTYHRLETFIQRWNVRQRLRTLIPNQND